jgi:hypothetical protein
VVAVRRVAEPLQQPDPAAEVDQEPGLARVHRRGEEPAGDAQQAPGDHVAVAVDGHRGGPAVVARDEQEPAPAVEGHVDRVAQQVAGEERYVGRLVGLLALGEEVLAQLPAAGPDEQRGPVDVDGLDPPLPPGADAGLEPHLDGGGGERGAAHDPLSGRGEDLELPAGLECSDRVQLAGGQPQRDRVVVEHADLGVGVAELEVEVPAGARHPQPSPAGRASRR